MRNSKVIRNQKRRDYNEKEEEFKDDDDEMDDDEEENKVIGKGSKFLDLRPNTKTTKNNKKMKIRGEKRKRVINKTSNKNDGGVEEEKEDDDDEDEDEHNYYVKFNKSKCFNDLNLIKSRSEKKLSNHDLQMRKLYESVDEVIDEEENQEKDEDEDEKVDDEDLLRFKFYDQISELSSIVNELNKSKEDEEEEFLSLRLEQIQNDIDSRPNLIFEFFRERVKVEFKRSFKAQLENHKLISDSREFRKKYEELIRTALT